MTLPQIRQTDSGPDRERQTAECKDPYQEAVNFSGGFMGRGWGRYWRGAGDGIDQIAVTRPPLPIPCDVWTNVWWRGPRDSNPGQVGDRMATPTAPPSYHRPRCDDCRAAGWSWSWGPSYIPTRSSQRVTITMIVSWSLLWSDVRLSPGSSSDPKIAICIQLTWRLLPCALLLAGEPHYNHGIKDFRHLNKPSLTFAIRDW